MSMTTMQQKRALVQEIQSSTEITGIKLLRDWLKDNGYEGSAECKHYAILRTSGRCMACKAIVTQPLVFDSSEAVGALRDRLRD